MRRKTTLLLVEPAFESYKGRIVRALRDNPDVTLLVASGLTKTIDPSWALLPNQEVISFSYVEDNLYERVTAYLSKHKLTLDGAFSFVDPSLKFVAQLQKKMGLPEMARGDLEALGCKYQVRELCRGQKIKQPKYMVTQMALTEADLTSKNLSFPLVLKPTQMMGGLGVFKVNTLEELNQRLQDIQTVDFPGEDLRSQYGELSTIVLVEEYLEGAEYSVECLVQNGRTTVLGVTDKRTDDGACFNNELGHTFPSKRIKGAELEVVEQFAAHVHAALGVNQSLTHCEFRMVEGEPYLIELNCRLGGGLISSLVESALGITFDQLILAANANVDITQDWEMPKESQSIQFVTTSQSGLVASAADQQMVGTCSKFVPFVEKGEVLTNVSGVSLHRLGYIIGSDPTEAMVTMAEEMAEAFDIQRPFYKRNLGPTEQGIMAFRAKMGRHLDDLNKIETLTWDEELRASKDTLCERIQKNPRSTLIAYSIRSGEPVGYISYVPVRKKDFVKNNPWEYYAGLAENQEYIEAVLAGGDFYFYVISVSSVPQSPRGTGAFLFNCLLSEARVAKSLGLLSGVRTPRYLKHSESGVDFETYYNMLQKKQVRERAYQAAYNSGARPIGFVENYFFDPDSKNYGVLMFHELKR